jgi:myo-inositol 2-dehydrogenase/D-chiro-inositol 1-dehydrogenase
MAVLHTGSGRQCHINTYRQASYGHDQRIEAFGSKGLLLNDHMRTRTESATKTPL